MTDTSKLDALVTRNIGDLEAAYVHAEELGLTLIEAIADVLREELGDGWHVEVDGDGDVPLWFAKRDWLGENSKSKKGRYAFELNENPGPGDAYEGTWLATLLSAGPQGATAIFYFWAGHFDTKRRWIRLMEEWDELVANLLEAGFKQDSKRWLYLPFALDSEVVAKGYETGDLSDALQPARNLASVIGATTQHLEQLVAHDRLFE